MTLKAESSAGRKISIPHSFGSMAHKIALALFLWLSGSIPKHFWCAASEAEPILALG